MAKNVYDDDESMEYRPPKKADVILKMEREISARQAQMQTEIQNSAKQIEAVLAELQNIRKDSEEAANKNGELIGAVQGDNTSLKREIKYLAVQNESIFNSLSERINKLEEALGNINAAEPVAQREEKSVPAEIDYDVLADKVAERIVVPAPVVQSDGAPVVYQTERQEVDYDLLVDKIVARLPVQDDAPLAAKADIDVEELARKVAENVSVPAPVYAEAAPAYAGAVSAAQAVTVSAEIDYDCLAEKVASRIPAPEVHTVYSEAAPAAVPVSAEIDYEELAEKVASKIPAPQVQAVYSEAAPAAVPVTAEIDYNELADKVISRIPLQEAVSPDYVAAKIAEQIILPQAPEVKFDYDELAGKVAEKITLPQAEVHAYAEAAPAAVAAEIDYDALAEKVAEKVSLPENAVDYELLADNIVARIPVQESISPEYVASLISENIPEREIVTADGQIDLDALAGKIAERIPAQEAQAVYSEAAPAAVTAELDYDALAENIVSRIPAQETQTFENVEIDYEALAEKLAGRIQPSGGVVDEEELSDRIALKVGSLKADDFDVLVDDEGCESISRTIAEKLDYELIASAVAEKLRAELDPANAEETDYEEMANRISEKITVAGINEDAIADKAAAALSNYLPEIDADEIADKVANQVISALPSVDNEYISSSVAEKIIEAQAEKDFDVIIDEEGVETISERLAEVAGNDNTTERFNSVDNDLAEIKALLANGAYVVHEIETVPAEEQPAIEEPEDEPEETLVTVSDIVEEVESGQDEEEITEEQPEEEVDEEVPEETEEPVEETVEEVTEEEIPEEQPEEEVVEEVPEETEESVEETVEEVTEEEITEEQPKEEVVEEVPAETQVETAETEENSEEDGDVEEFTLDDLTDGQGEGGVDFANMMRYNRSFIARIIQSTDDQKGYYGEVRNALLSYKKVNSNIAWGAERFHKGRETIARFKIRGKTLCLYLALNPKEHEYSVYHHKDVSGVRMFDGTPMMIKVQSPRGVKKAIRLIDEMLEARGGIKRNVPQRDYAAMYPYETIEELIEDGLVKDVNKK